MSMHATTLASRPLSRLLAGALQLCGRGAPAMPALSAAASELGRVGTSSAPVSSHAPLGSLLPAPLPQPALQMQRSFPLGGSGNVVLPSQLLLHFRFPCAASPLPWQPRSRPLQAPEHRTGVPARCFGSTSPSDDARRRRRAAAAAAAVAATFTEVVPRPEQQPQLAQQQRQPPPQQRQFERPRQRQPPPQQQQPQQQTVVMLASKVLKLTPRIAEHDLATKLRKAEGWLDDGIRVTVSVEYEGKQVEAAAALVDTVVARLAGKSQPMGQRMVHKGAWMINLRPLTSKQPQKQQEQPRPPQKQQEQPQPQEGEPQRERTKEPQDAGGVGGSGGGGGTAPAA